MPHLDEQREALLEQLERRASAAIIAPAGAGKSCLLRSLRARLPEARYRVHYVKVTDLSKRDFSGGGRPAPGLQRGSAEQSAEPARGQPDGPRSLGDGVDGA